MDVSRVCWTFGDLLNSTVKSTPKVAVSRVVPIRLRHLPRYLKCQDFRLRRCVGVKSTHADSSGGAKNGRMNVIDTRIISSLTFTFPN